MAITSSRSKASGPVLRSGSPSGRFSGVYTSSFASSTSSFTSPSSTFFSNNNHNHSQNHHRSASPTRVNLFQSSSIRYSIENTRSVTKPQPKPHNKINRRCMCSPTTHPGSFRCALHKNVANPHGQGAVTYPTSSLNMRRSAMTNSLVRIGGVEGEWVRRALTTLIRPSSHQLKRRTDYLPRRSRLSSMSNAQDEGL